MRKPNTHVYDTLQSDGLPVGLQMVENKLA